MKARTSQERAIKEVKKVVKDINKEVDKTQPKEKTVKYTNEFILGENFINEARTRIGVSNHILTDEIITAKLHLGIARKQVEVFLNRKTYPDNKEQVRDIAINYLCGSICHALFSKTNDVEIYKKYVDFYFKANNAKVALL